MEKFETMSPIEMAKLVLQLRHGLDPEVESFVFRFGSFSLGVQLRFSSEGTSKDSSQLNPNAKVFNKISAECLKKQGTKDPKESSQSKKLTGKANALRILDLKRKQLSSLRTQVKETQKMLDGKGSFDQYDFNWTLPSAPEDTLCGLNTHIRHLRRKKAKMCELLESVSQVVSEDETGKLKEGILESMEEDVASMTEKFDEGKRGGAEPEVTEADAKRLFLWTLQSLAGDEPSEDILEKMGATNEYLSNGVRILGDDEPHDDELCRLGMSKEDLFEAKRRMACVNAFGCDFEKKMRKYWNAFRDGCKGRDVSEMGRVMEENFVMNGISTSSAT